MINQKKLPSKMLGSLFSLEIKNVEGIGFDFQISDHYNTPYFGMEVTEPNKATFANFNDVPIIFPSFWEISIVNMMCSPNL
ncbi:hypothetical protein [Pseudogracilibacillus sp. SO30301A]|uniref:hypothetical protein n=1 Tax=Pseudogracilibacillus sp. SO30301A TaxID=3098291 RepID=UPI00300DE30A